MKCHPCIQRCLTYAACFSPLEELLCVPELGPALWQSETFRPVLQAQQRHCRTPAKRDMSCGSGVTPPHLSGSRRLEAFFSQGQRGSDGRRRTTRRADSAGRDLRGSGSWTSWSPREVDPKWPSSSRRSNLPKDVEPACSGLRTWGFAV